MVNRQISIHQPSFLPWAGLIHKIISSDIHIFYSTAQFEKGGYQNRVKYDGGWLTVPVSMSGLPPINEVKVAHPKRELPKILRRLEQTEKKNPFFFRLERVLQCLEDYSKRDDVLLWALNLDLTTAMLLPISKENWIIPIWMDSQSLYLTATDPVEKLDEAISIARKGFMDSQPFTYLAGSGFLNYIGDKKMKVPVLIQKTQQVNGKDPSSESFVRILTTIEDPVTYLQEQFVWETLV